MNRAERYGGVITMIDIGSIRENYPPTISSEQLRKLLHVSRRRCVWLLKHHIPHSDTGKKTRRYTIDLETAVSFLIDFEESPELFSAAPGEFSTYNKYVRKKLIKEDNTFDDKLRKRILKKYDAIPDVLDSKAVSKLTGYSVNAVNRWMQKGKLRSVLTPNGRITSKEWVVEFIRW